MQQFTLVLKPPCGMKCLIPFLCSVTCASVESCPVLMINCCCCKIYTVNGSFLSSLGLPTLRATSPSLHHIILSAHEFSTYLRLSLLPYPHTSMAVGHPFSQLPHTSLSPPNQPLCSIHPFIHPLLLPPPRVCHPPVPFLTVTVICRFSSAGGSPAAALC